MRPKAVRTPPLPHNVWRCLIPLSASDCVTDATSHKESSSQMRCPHCKHEGPPVLSGPYDLHSEVPRGLVWLCANDECKAILSVSTEQALDGRALPKAA